MDKIMAAILGRFQDKRRPFYPMPGSNRVNTMPQWADEIPGPAEPGELYDRFRDAEFIGGNLGPQQPSVFSPPAPPDLVELVGKSLDPRNTPFHEMSLEEKLALKEWDLNKSIERMSQRERELDELLKRIDETLAGTR